MSCFPKSTALHKAARHGRAPVVSYLMSIRIPVNVEDDAKVRGTLLRFFKISLRGLFLLFVQSRTKKRGGGGIFTAFFTKLFFYIFI